MQVKKIEWTELAVQDLYSIKMFVAENSPKNSNILYEKIFDSVNMLAKFSRKGRKIPNIDEDFYREVFVESFRIMYKIESDRIFIMAIFHMSKDFKIDDLMKRNDF